LARGGASPSRGPRPLGVGGDILCSGRLDGNFTVQSSVEMVASFQISLSATENRNRIRAIRICRATMRSSPHRRTAMLKSSRLVLVLCLLCVGPFCVRMGARPQSGTKNGEWRNYGGDLGSTRYAPLDQINADNFGKLEIAWRFKTDSLGPRPEFKFESTPLMVHGVLYSTGGSRRAVVALDAATGELLWTHREDE